MLAAGSHLSVCLQHSESDSGSRFGNVPQSDSWTALLYVSSRATSGDGYGDDGIDLGHPCESMLHGISGRVRRIHMRSGLKNSIWASGPKYFTWVKGCTISLIIPWADLAIDSYAWLSFWTDMEASVKVSRCHRPEAGTKGRRMTCIYRLKACCSGRYLPIYLSIYLSIELCIYQSIYLSIYLYLCAYIYTHTYTY